MKNVNEKNFQDQFENFNTRENYELENVEEVLKSLDKRKLMVSSVVT